MIVVSLGS